MRSILLVLAALGHAPSLAAADVRPNIVLIGAEDISPSLGCYGDPDAITPNLDRLASRGARFTRAFTHAPVCAPSRSGLITGMYPTTIGSHHMRSKLIDPPPTLVAELRKAGYFVAWPAGPLGKTDFNFDVPKDWVDSAVDWTRRPEVLPKDRPWFAYVNYTMTHESKVRATREEYETITARLGPGERRDRAKVALPPYFPDTPAVRECVGKYHDNLTALDYTIGDLMKVVDDLPHPENTVVVFFGDHGWGLPRGKRWCYDSGTRIPLLVRWPGRIEPGTIRDDLVCLLDLAPTFLALAGVPKPGRMVGRVFLGDRSDPAPKYVFGARDRMDEAYDRVRSARGERYRYIKNFHPELPYAQYINYLDEMPIMRDWRRLAFEGKLNDVQRAFFARSKPVEELYDLEADPYEVRNLAGSPDHRAILEEMRAAVERWVVETKDLGAVPEKELIRRGLVKDVLSAEYDARVRLHPAGPPVP
jgi:uncharacterized sulfatase